jgi:hypothetical protein
MHILYIVKSQRSLKDRCKQDSAGFIGDKPSWRYPDSGRALLWHSSIKNFLASSTFLKILMGVLALDDIQNIRVRPNSSRIVIFA